MQRDILRLVDEFAAASLDGELWISSLSSLADATGSARAQLIGIGSARTEIFNFVSASHASELERFEEIASYDPAVNFRVAASIKAVPLQILGEADYDAELAHLSDGGYRDYCFETDMEFGGQTTLLQNEGGLVGLSTLRTRRDGRTTERQRAVFAAIAPHVRSAVRVQQVLEGNAARLVIGALETMNIAAFACDVRGNVHGCSRSAEALLQTGAMTVTARRLGCRIKADSDALNRALHRVLTSADDRIVSVGVLDDGDPLILDVVALPKREWNLGFEPHALVVARGREQDPARSMLLLRSAYGLSDAEAQIAMAYAQGEKPLHHRRGAQRQPAYHPRPDQGGVRQAERQSRDRAGDAGRAFLLNRRRRVARCLPR